MLQVLQSLVMLLLLRLLLRRTWAAIAVMVGVGLALGLAAHEAHSQTPVPQVRVATDSAGIRLQVDGRPFMVNGVNWDLLGVAAGAGLAVIVVHAVRRLMGRKSGG